jgi:hypothetical protein
MTTVFGYVKVNEFLPSFVSVLAKDEKGVFIRHPSLSEQRVAEDNISTFKSSERFVAEPKKERILKEGEFAAIFSQAEEAFIGNEKEMKVCLEKQLLRAEISESERGIIEGMLSELR